MSTQPVSKKPNGVPTSPRPRNLYHRTARDEKPKLHGRMSPVQASSTHTSTLSSKMRAQGIRTLSRTLPSGFQTFFTLRYLGKRHGTDIWGCYIECPECHIKPDPDQVPPHRRWQWLTMHTLVAHREVFVVAEEAGNRKSA